MNFVNCEKCGKQFSRFGIGAHMWRVHGAGKDFKPFVNKTSWNKGLTAETDSRVRAHADQRRHIKSLLEIELDDDGELYSKYKSKLYNDKFHENRGFELSFDEYCLLVKEAGLKSSQLGFKGEGYVLARYNDQGPYKYGNCRFITHAENIAEMFYCPTATSLYEYLSNYIPQSNLHIWKQDPRWIQIKLKEYIDHIKHAKRENRKCNRCAKVKFPDKKSNLSYVGVNNSQFGTFWITNGTYNSKWKESFGALPEGYRKGRILKLPYIKSNPSCDNIGV